MSKDLISEEFSCEDECNFIAVRSNLDNWNESVAGYSKDKNRDVIFLETVNYSYDDEEQVYKFTSLSVPQAKFLIEKLSEVVEYIENKSNRR